jgi:ribokinase
MLAGLKPIVVVGSINFDLVARTEHIPVVGETLLGDEFQTHPGGKGANQAVAIARLGYPVQMIGRLGSDSFGEQLRAGLESSGVDVTGVDTVEGASGVAVILVALNGGNSIVVIPGANAHLSPQYLDLHLDRIRQAGMVLTQLEIPMETVEYLAEICHRFGVPLMLDPAPARSLSPSLLAQIDWFTPNEVESAFYVPSEISGSLDDQSPRVIARSILAHGSRGVILKMGSRGAYLASEGVDEYLDAIPVEAVDTTAAGDAFNGAFAVGLQLGKSPLESARFAVAAAACSVTRSGAQPSMPLIREVEELLNNGVPQNLKREVL